jgi:hypothetical protein
VRERTCLIHDESGAVESALVLLPLLILVLSILQIACGVLNRDLAASGTQSVVTRSGLYSPDGSTPFARMANNGITSAVGLALSGGGTLYLGERQFHLPGITPLLVQGESFASIGASLGENP